MATGRETESVMMHLECNRCGMMATIVQTEAGERAWHDHMLTHDNVADFRVWIWTVVELPLDDA